MQNNQIKTRIIKCIKTAHLLSNKMGGLSSIHYDYLINNLSDISSTDIHVELLYLKDKGKIDYNSDTGIIILKENYIE